MLSIKTLFALLASLQSSAVAKNFESYDGMKVFYKVWEVQTQPPVARVLAINGLGEYIERYDQIFSAFANNGIKVVGMDLRGFGRTFHLQSREKQRNAPVQRGYLAFESAFKDIEVLSKLFPLEEGLPTFLWGHSMGGLIMLRFAENHADTLPNFRGVIAQAPAISPVIRVPSYVHWLFRIPFMGRYTASSNLDTSTLSEAELQDLKTNPLLHQKISIQLVNDIVRAEEQLLNHPDRFTAPILIAQNVNDKIISYTDNLDWFGRIASSDKEFHSVPGDLRHAIHLVDSVKDELVGKYVGWIRNRL